MRIAIFAFVIVGALLAWLTSVLKLFSGSWERASFVCITAGTAAIIIEKVLSQQLSIWQSNKQEKFQKKALEGQEVTNEKLDNVLQLLEQASRDNWDRLIKEYPYGFVVFGGKTGNVRHLPFNHFVSDLRIEIEADWAGATFGEHEDWQTPAGEPQWLVLEIPHYHWRAINKDGQVVNQEYGFSYTAMRMENGWRIRSLDTPGRVNRYIEVIDDSIEHPACVMGFKIQTEAEDETEPIGIPVPIEAFGDPEEAMAACELRIGELLEKLSNAGAVDSVRTGIEIKELFLIVHPEWEYIRDLLELDGEFEVSSEVWNELENLKDRPTAKFFRNMRENKE